MSRDLFNRYAWIVDTIRRFGRITRRQLDEFWQASASGDGNPLPRRTFHNYLRGAEEMFGIEIKCDPSTFEYYIDNHGDTLGTGVADWLLNSVATNEVLSHSSDVASRIFLEDVPSARIHLAPVIDALRNNRILCFDYHPYQRRLATRDVLLEPLFLKIFRQRWYITGRNSADGKIKTYALDRISALRLTTDTFTPDPTFDPAEYSRNAFGIIFSEGEVRKIELKVDTRQAKYFRALPLHHSQEEFVHDEYSIFTYRLRITPDFVEELLSHGARVTVLAPPELRAMVKKELQEALDNYNNV